MCDKLYVLFYDIQSLSQYSMEFNCVPDSKPFTAGRRNFVFLSLLLFLLLIIVIPVGYSITRYVHCKLSELKHGCSLYGILIGYSQVQTVVHLEDSHSCILWLMILSVI